MKRRGRPDWAGAAIVAAAGACIAWSVLQLGGKLLGAVLLFAFFISLGSAMKERGLPREAPTSAMSPPAAAAANPIRP